MKSLVYLVSHSMYNARCNEDASSYVVCGTGNDTSVAMDTLTRGGVNETAAVVRLIPGTDVLKQLDVTLPFYVSYFLLILVGVIFRVLAYIALRFLHRKHQ